LDAGVRVVVPRVRVLEPPVVDDRDRVVADVPERVLELRDPDGEDVRVAMETDPRGSSLQSHASHACVGPRVCHRL